MKRILTIGLLIFCLCPSLVLADKATFKMSAIIPAIVGLNVFPDRETNAPETVAVREHDITTELAIRNGQQVMLQTIVVR